MAHRLSRILIAVLTFLLFLPVQAQISQNEPLLLAVGGGYNEVYTGLIQAAIPRSVENNIILLVLPMNLTINSSILTPAERAQILEEAAKRGQELESRCKELAQNGRCTILLAPILTRSDARNSDYLALFNQELSGILLLDGDEERGTEVLAGTPLEFELITAYERGVVIAGSGAGSVMLANPMVGNYLPGLKPSDGLRFGAVQVWDTAEKHGLLFGVRNAFLEDYFFGEGDLGKMLNAISLPNVPDIGIGLDANSGIYIAGGVRIEKVIGDPIAIVLDGATYHASAGVQYQGKQHLISLRNVLFHTLAPGDVTFDLSRRVHALGAPYHKLERDYSALHLPAGAGNLFLTSDLLASEARDSLLNQFIQRSGGSNAKILILADGYSSRQEAETIAAEFAKMMPVDTVASSLPIQTDALKSLTADISGILITIGAPEKIDRSTLAPLEALWRDGLPILCNQGAAEITGAYFTPKTGISPDGEGMEPVSPLLAMRGELEILPGLGWVNGFVVTNILEERRFGQLINLAYHHPDLLALGLTGSGAVELSPSVPRATGENAVFVLDLRWAQLARGENNGLVIANGIMDVFAPGELFTSVVVDVNRTPRRLATPVIVTPTATPPPTSTPTPSPSPTVTASPTISPTATQRIKPTATPLIIPPPSDPETRNFMVIFGVLIVIVIVIGLALNRKRIV